MSFGVAHGPLVVRNLPKRHWEDGRHFRHNRERIHSLADCFTKPSAWSGAEATYRPLSANLYYFAGRTLFGNRLEVYHAIGAVAHLVNAVLLLLLCCELLPWPMSFLPPVLFVSRVAHRQDLAYTSNFDTLSYTAFGLAGLLLFVRARHRQRRDLEALAAMAVGISLLCKEAGAAWPAVLTAYGCLFDRRRAWRRYATAWLPVVGWAAAYPTVLRALYPAEAPGFTLDFHPLGLVERYAAYLLTFPNVLVPNVDPEGAGWAMPPHVATVAHTTPAVFLVATLMIGPAIVVARAWIHPATVGTPWRVAAFGVAWFLCGMAPFAILGERLFARYAYMAHAGLALALGGVAAAVVSRVAGVVRSRRDRSSAVSPGGAAPSGPAAA